MIKRINKIVALIMCGTMALSLAGCGKTDDKVSESSSDVTESSGAAESSAEESQTEEASEEVLPTWQPGDEVTTVSLYNSYQGGGSDVPWFQDYLAENIGVNIDARLSDGSSNVMTTILASGEYPDIITFDLNQDPTALGNAIAGDNLLNLEDYKEYLPEIFEGELSSYYEIALKYSKEVYGEGEGIFCIPVNLYGGGSLNSQPILDWDLYMDLGCPEMPDDDAYLNILKDMMELQPETADGLPRYGIAVFNSFDGRFMYNTWNEYLSRHGAYEQALNYFIVANADGSGEPIGFTEDDGPYKAALDFLYKANQMGVVDPESTSMTWDIYMSKAGATQLLSMGWNWFNVGDSSKGEGFEPVWADSWTVGMEADYVIGKGWWIAISADTENLEAALRYLNWYFSREAIDLTKIGPEGAKWDWADDSHTEWYFNDFNYNGDGQIGSGGTVGEADAMMNCGAINYLTYAPDGSKLFMSGDSTVNAKSKERLGMVPYSVRFLEWQDLYGDYASMSDYQMANGMPTATMTTAGYSFVEAASSDIDMLADNIGQIVKELSWKMVFAEDDAEYNALWEQMKADTEAMGIQDVIDDAKARFAKALETAASYGVE